MRDPLLAITIVFLTVALAIDLAVNVGAGRTVDAGADMLMGILVIFAVVVHVFGGPGDDDAAP